MSPRVSFFILELDLNEVLASKSNPMTFFVDLIIVT